MGNHRNFRQLIGNVEASFYGDNAKLEWFVSLDGKKKQSEAYKVLAILDKPKNGQSLLNFRGAGKPTIKKTIAVMFALLVRLSAQGTQRLYESA